MKPTDKKVCFVIMPFGQQGTVEYERNFSIYRDMIKPVVEGCGYEAIRADEVEHPGSITRSIIEYLHRSDLVVSDLSGRNANVFYELGVRHALYRAGTVLICRAGEELPFDIKDYRVLFYSIELSGPERFRKDLQRRIKAFERYQQSTSDNPVHDILGDKICLLNNRDYISLREYEEKLSKTAIELQEKEKEVKDLQLKLQEFARDKKAEPEDKLKEINNPKPGDRFTNSLKMTFVYVHPGKFMMGNTEVTLSKGFFMQTTQVTQGQWKALMGNNPSEFKECGDNCPVEKFRGMMRRSLSKN